jgi:hypothetical protein
VALLLAAVAIMFLAARKPWYVTLPAGSVLGAVIACLITWPDR